MKRFFGTAMAAVVLFTVLCIQSNAEVVAEYGKGKREDINGVTVVHLAGSHREMGLQHGNLLKPEIHKLTNYFFEEKGAMFGASIGDIRAAAAVIEPFIPAKYIEEMKAVAEGAEVDYEKVLFSNIFLDVVSAHWVGVGPQCSNFAALPSITRNGDIVHGRNLDWSADATIASVNTLFIYRPDDGIAFAAPGWPAIVGILTGLNAEKISMGEMTSMSSDASLRGTPIMIQLRMLMEKSRSLDDAFSVLKDNPRTTGYNVIVADAKAADAMVVEQSASDIFRAGPKDGFVHRANHYLHPKLQQTQTRYMAMFYEGKKSDTYYRHQRLEQLVRERSGQIDAEAAMSIMSDKFDLSIGAIPENLKNTVCKSNTLQSVVMLPGSGEIYVGFKDIPVCHDFVRVKVEF